MTQQLQLFDGLSLYEGSDVEYKGALGGLPGDLWKTYSAFANTEGGTLWLGITQRIESLDVHGVENAERLLSDFWNTINNRGKVSRNLLTNASVVSHALPNGRKVIFIEVPRANRRERPIYLGGDPFKGTYRRNFEGDYLCNEDEVRRMFADQSDEPADSRILVGFSFDDLHEESIRQFRNRFSSRAPDHPWLSEDDHGLLERLGGWRRERGSNVEGPTLAGLLMFGKSQAILDPRASPGFNVDYRERFSDDPNIRWTDRLTLDGTWEGNLFQFYQRVAVKLGNGPGIKKPFNRDEEGYRQAETPVHEALREALVNALIHADYSGQGGIVIDRYIDLFEFSNPGTLLVSREQILRGGISECRNKALQRMFQMLGVGDKAGSGIDKIRSSWAAQHWRSPSLQETFRPDRVRLLLPLVSMLPDDLLQQLRKHFGSSSVEELSHDEIQAVVTAASEGLVSNQRLQEMLPLHRVEITKLLKELCRRGLLKAEGIGRGTRYILGDGLQLEDGENRGANSPISEGISPINEGNSPINDGMTLSAASDHKLLAIAQAIRESKRASQEQIVAAVLKLCEDRFLTLSELAALLDRRPKGLREVYLSKLVRSGQLELRYPERPNHPQQAYKVRARG